MATAQLLARAMPTVTPTPTAEEEISVSTPETELSGLAGEGEAPTAENLPAEPALDASVSTPAADQPTTAVAATPTAPATPTVAPSPTATSVPPTATVPPPSATVVPASGSKANTYRIRSGDTLSGIAQRFDVSLEALLAANRITAKATLRIGQALVIPGTGAPVAPTATPKPQATPAPTKPALPPTPAPYLPAPVLTGPGDQASYRGDKEQIFLIWDSGAGHDRR